MPEFTPVTVYEYDVPLRSQEQSVFNVNMAAMFTHIALMGPELTLFQEEVNLAIDEIETAATVALDAVADVLEAVDVVVNAAGAVAFVPSAVYTLTQCAISNINFQTYRHITASSSLVTDPLNDPTNWTKISGGGSARIYTVASVTPLAWNSDLYDTTMITALAANLTINADIGVGQYDGQKHLFIILDNGVTRTLTLTGGAKGLRVIDVYFPSATSAGKYLYFGAVWSASDGMWHIIGKALER